MSAIGDSSSFHQVVLGGSISRVASLRLKCHKELAAPTACVLCRMHVQALQLSSVKTTQSDDAVVGRFTNQGEVSREFVRNRGRLILGAYEFQRCRVEPCHSWQTFVDNPTTGARIGDREWANV